MTSFSRVLPTSRVGYHAGKPIKSVVYCLSKLSPRNGEICEVSEFNTGSMAWEEGQKNIAYRVLDYSYFLSCRKRQLKTLPNNRFVSESNTIPFQKLSCKQPPLRYTTATTFNKFYGQNFDIFSSKRPLGNYHL